MEEVREGTFVSQTDVRFFGAFLPAIRDPKISIPVNLLAKIFDVAANAYDMVG